MLTYPLQDIDMIDLDTKSEISVKTASPEPNQRIRLAAAIAGDNDYRNPDESDSDMSDATFEMTADFEFDSLMRFPPAPGTMDPRAAVHKPHLYRKPPTPLKPVKFNVSLSPDTPSISWLTRRAKQMAEDEDEELNPGTKTARTNKKIRRRLEPFQNKPKRPYNWRTPHKNKRKAAGADAASKELAVVEKEGRVTRNGKRVRYEESDDEDEDAFRADGKRRREVEEDDDDDDLD